LLSAGWRFNNKGECTKMPSTMLCRGVAGKPPGSPPALLAMLLLLPA